MRAWPWVGAILGLLVLGSNSDACGRRHCRCHGGIPAKRRLQLSPYNATTYSAANVQSFDVPTFAPVQLVPFSFAPRVDGETGAAQHSLVAGLLSGLLERAVTDLLSDLVRRRDGGDSPSNLITRVEALESDVRKNSRDISDLVAAQQELADQIDQKLDRLQTDLGQRPSPDSTGDSPSDDETLDSLNSRIQSLRKTIEEKEQAVETMETHIDALDGNEALKDVREEAQANLEETMTELDGLVDQLDELEMEFERRTQ